VPILQRYLDSEQRRLRTGKRSTGMSAKNVLHVDPTVRGFMETPCPRIPLPRFDDYELQFERYHRRSIQDGNVMQWRNRDARRLTSNWLWTYTEEG